jgi:hypothetical protein
MVTILQRDFKEPTSGFGEGENVRRYDSLGPLIQNVSIDIECNKWTRFKYDILYHKHQV